jgi:hypothetical protein
MKLQRFKERLIANAERFGIYLDGLGSGLLLAYVIFSFSYPLPITVIFAAVAIIAIGAWLPVIAHHKMFDGDHLHDKRHDA